jgi:pSer/pThr/pTyr-binding forkhead associated (FHA) protein
MEEVQRDKVSEYLLRMRKLGREQFLLSYPHPVLLENYSAPSSRVRLGRVETISEAGNEDGLAGMEIAVGEDILEALVISLEKTDVSSSERMIFVGRSVNNDIVLRNERVSKLHAYFCQIPGSQVYQVVDMSSTNGTFVNGDMVSPSVKTNLTDGDELSFGPGTNLKFYSAAGFYELLTRLD